MNTIIDAKKGMVNISVLLYFLFFVLVNQKENYVFFIGFYTSLLLCGFVGLYTANFQIQLKEIAIIFVLIATAGINSVLVGNTTLKQVIYIGLFAFSSLSLISEKLDENTLLIAFTINVIVILYKIATVGVSSDQLFTNASRNYVSVFLLYPLTIYYSIIDRKKKSINLIPVVVAWVLCLISKGRGGIISSTVLLAGICIIKYRSIRLAKRIIAFISCIAVIVFGFSNMTTLVQKAMDSSAMEMFARNGMRTVRSQIWPEYLESATTNTKSFILGANVYNTTIGRDYDGNPHNSFIEIHMMNGFIGLTVIMVALFVNGVRAVNRKNYLFLVCMISILLRAFTDHVLWNSFGTPVLFYFLFYYDTVPEYSQ